MTEWRNQLKSLACKVALKQCIRSLDIKKVLPPFKDLPYYDQMPVALFNWNYESPKRRRTTMMQHNLLLQQVTLESLEQQKYSVDYQQLIALVEKILFNFGQKDTLQGVMELLKRAKASLETLTRLHEQLSDLQAIRKTMLSDECSFFDHRLKRKKSKRSDIFPECVYPTAALIQVDVKKKYYRQIHESVNEHFELERNETQKQIDDLLVAIDKEEFCGEKIANTYREQAYYYAYRIEKLGNKFEEERVKQEDEIAAKVLEIKNMHTLWKNLHEQMLSYRMKKEEFLAKMSIEEEAKAKDKNPLMEFVQQVPETAPATTLTRVELQQMMRQEKKKKKVPKPIEEQFKEVEAYEGESKLEDLKGLLKKKFDTSIKKVLNRRSASSKIVKRALKFAEEN